MRKGLFVFFIFVLANSSFAQFNFSTLTQSTPQTHNNRNNFVIENLSFTNLSGDILSLNNCTNVTIRNCYFGASLGEAISINRGSNITIQNCFFANNRTGVYSVQTSGGVKVLNNQFVNMHGPMPRGQYVQFNQCTGAGNVIEGNKGECFWAESYPEDLISLFGSIGTSASPIIVRNNIFRGGGPSSSGGGIMTGDYGGSYILVENNKIINPGQYGIAAAGGHDIVLNNNQVYSERKSWNNIAMYVWAQEGASCSNITVTNNRVNYINAGGAVNNWWDGGNCGSINWDATNGGGLTLATMGVPSLLFDIDENKLWQIRKDAWSFRNQIGIYRPTANAGADKTITGGTTTLTASASSSTNGINYKWAQVSGPSTSVIGNATSSTANISNLATGVYEFRLEITDNAGAADADWVTITVSNGAVPNQAPVANAGTDISLTLPTNSTTLTGTGTDADGTVDSYAWARVSGPTTFTLANAGSASTALTNLVQGTYVFALTVTDNNGATTTDNVTVTVNPAPTNQAPVANAGTDVNLTLPTNSTTLTGTATDADGTIASYVWSRVSGPTTFTLSAASSASTGLSNLVQGTYIFRLTVTDNNGATATDNVTVIVNAAANQAPVANAGNDITLTLPTNSTTLTGTGTDADGTIASYAWSRVSGPTTFTLSAASSASTGLSNLVQGTYIFRLTVADNNGATGTDNITVVVNAAPANQAPVANAGTDITLTLPTNSTTLTGTGTDADGTVASYAWARVSGPTTFTLSAATSASTGLSNLVQGTYVFRLTVTDNNGATATDNVTVTVNAAANQAPVANAGNDIAITLPVNSTTLNGSASTDADGTIASYAWARVSGPTAFTLSAPTSVSTGVTNLVQGTYVFRLTVTDNSGATSTDNITVVVNPAPANQAPVANAGNDITLTLPTNNTVLSGTGTDADGTIASYAWVRVSGPTTFTLSAASSAATGLSNLVQGTYVFRLTVTDNRGATATDLITVTVNAAAQQANQKPKAKAKANSRTLTITENYTTLSGIESEDVDGRIVSYQWQQESGPTASTLTTTNAVSTDISNLQVGTYIYRLTVTDNNNATDTTTISVDVVDNFRGSGAVALYPNPAIDFVNIVLRNDAAGAVSIKIYNARGMQVVPITQLQKPQGLFIGRINTAGLKPGMYIIETIQGKNKRITSKFIKK